MTRVTITLLGGLEARVDGQAVPGLAGGKTAALLAYLALEQQTSHSRESLAALFWPELSLEAARRNLRQTLFQIRSHLEDPQGEPLILADRERVRFNTDADHWLDTTALLHPPEECPHRTEPDALCPDCLEPLRAAIDHYRGPLLAGLVLPEAMEEVDDWLQARRETLHRQALWLLERLTRHYEQAGQLQRALRYAHRYTELEPLSEGGHATLMRLLTLTGQPNAALAQFESCRRLLERELAVEPSTTLSDLAEEIRSGQLRPATSLRGPQARAASERRFLVALACRFSVDLPDPEDQTERLRPFLERAQEQAAEWGGYTDRPQGGGLLAYFGFPSPDEHAVIRALEAARTLQDLGERVGVRVAAGIHAGTVLYSPAGGHPDGTGLLAQEALQWAERGRGGIQLSPSAAPAAEDRYRLEPLDTAPLHGGCRLVGARPGPAPGPPLASGAQQRLAELEGAEGPVLLEGPPGSGKSRLLAELQARARQPLLLARCLPWQRGCPFASLRGIVTQALNLAEDGANESVARAAEARGLDGSALAIPFGTGSPASAERLSAALLHLLEGGFFGGVVLEDLQWADPATQALFGDWAAGSLPAPQRVIATARPGAVPDIPGLRLNLEPETGASLRTLVDAASEPPLGAEAREEMIRRAQGNPGLALALAREKGRSNHELPTALLLRLQAEWAPLAGERTTARQAAAWGDPFTAEELALATEREVDEVTTDLEALARAGLVVTSREGRWRFRDPVTREALYEGLPRSERHSLHARFARTLQHQPSGGETATLEAVARQWGLAGEAATASQFWLRAARQALAAGHTDTALADCRQGLGEVQSMGPGHEPGHIRALWLVLGQAEMLRQGPSAPRAATALRRARLGCRQLTPDPETCFQARWGRWLRATAESGHPAGREEAFHLRSLTEGEAALRPAAELAVGLNAYWLGRLGEAAHSLRHAAMAATAFAAPPLLPEPRMAALSQLGLTWWQMGFSDQALEAGLEACDWADRQGGPAERATCLTGLALLHHQRGEAGPAQEASAAALKDCGEGDTAWEGAAARLLHGWALAQQGVPPAPSNLWKDCETVADHSAGLGAASACWAAEALLEADRPGAACEFVRTGLERAGALGERASLPELYRLQGESAARMGGHSDDAVEVWLQRALDTACNQSAPALALRCAVALGRHWHARGRSAEARCLVDGYAHGFHEGSETADLQAARRLLETRRRPAI